jgi:hypothetical protein
MFYLPKRLEEKSGARGTRTLTASRPGDFKSQQYLNWLYKRFHESLTACRSGDFEKEKKLGLLPATQPMRTEASGAGFYQSAWERHPRLQILTIAELLEGKRVDMPPLRQVNVTFKQAPKARAEQPEMPPLPF